MSSIKTGLLSAALSLSCVMAASAAPPVKEVLQSSFKPKGQATLERLDQDKTQQACSTGEALSGHVDAVRAQGWQSPLCVDLCTGSGTIAFALANELRHGEASLATDALERYGVDPARPDAAGRPPSARPQRTGLV